MAQDDERFTPEEVDEQVERLTNSLHVTPPERLAPDTQLIDTLQRLYPPDEADARSLERVWHRLERRGVAPHDEEPRKIVPLAGIRFRRERYRLMKSPSVTSDMGRKLSVRIASIAALFLLVALVGGLSIGLVLVHHGGNGAGTAGAVTTRTATQTPVAASLGSIYIESYAGVYKVDATTGKVLWSYPAGPNTPPVVVAVGGVVYIGNQGDVVQALNASTGKLLWQKNIGNASAGSPQIVVADSVIYAASETDGNLYALNASDGTVRWHAPLVTDIGNTTSIYFTAVSVAQGMIYGSFMGDLSDNSAFSYLYAARAQDGSLLWKMPISSDQTVNRVVLSNDVLYTTSSEISHHSGNEPQGSYAYAFNPANGNMLWQSKKTNGFVLDAPAVGDGGVYFGAQQDGVYAVSAQDGSPLWHALAGANIYPSPQVANGVVYVGQTSNNGASGNYLIALSSSTGAVLWQHPLVNYLGHSEFAVFHGVVYVTTDDGYLYALNASDGSQLWRTRYYKNAFGGQPGSVTFGQ